MSMIFFAESIYPMQPDPSYEALLLRVAEEVNGIRRAATLANGHLSAHACEEAKPHAQECFERVEALAQRLLENYFSLDRLPLRACPTRQRLDTPEAHELLSRLEGLWQLAAQVDQQLEIEPAIGSRVDRSDGLAEWQSDLHSGLILLTCYLRCMMAR